MRLFFAVWPDDQQRQRIHQLTRKVVKHSGGKPIIEDNLHLTLAFLGDVEVADSARTAAAGVVQTEFEFSLDRYGYFAPARSLWLGPAALPQALMDLQAQLWDRLTAAGFRRDSKPFRPHVTLARKAPAPRAIRSPQPLAWQVREFALIQSETAPEGARYHRLHQFQLLGS